MIRPIKHYDEARVRHIYYHCHPMWPEPREHEFFCYPTLVYIANYEIVGYTSFSISELHGLKTLVGHDVGVHPDFTGLGYGSKLHDARVAYGVGVGCRRFIGMTWDANKAMTQIFIKSGYHACEIAQGAYPNNTPPCDGVIWVGNLGG